jgi:hypothetical protein
VDESFYRNELQHMDSHYHSQEVKHELDSPELKHEIKLTRIENMRSVRVRDAKSEKREAPHEMATGLEPHRTHPEGWFWLF